MNTLTGSKTDGLWIIMKPAIIFIFFVTTTVLLLNTFYIGWDYAPFFWNWETANDTLTETLGLVQHP